MLVALFVLSNERAHAAVEIQMLSPSLSSPQPVGTTVIWTTTASDTSPGTLTYQFSVRPPGGDFAVVRDFDDSNSFEWTPSEREGEFDVRVAVKNNSTAEVATLTTSYSVSSRVTGDNAVISSTENPLVALYSAPACGVGSMRVRFWRTGALASQTTSWKSCIPGVSMNFYVAGMLPSTGYSMRHEVSSDPSAPLTAGPTLSFTTGALPPDIVIPAMSVATPSAGDSGQEVLLNTYPNRAALPSTAATNLSGNLLWYYGRNNISYITRPVEGGTVLLFANEPERLDTLREIDLAGKTVRETNIKALSDQLVALGGPTITSVHHDARRLADGRTLVLGGTERVLSDVQGPGPVAIVGDVIMVLDENWQVLWYWDSFDHLDVTRKALLDEKCPLLCVTPSATANDWTHSNSIAYSPDDGNLMLSIRHQDWVIKIDYRDGAGTGDILWRLGKDGDFTYESADPYPWFSHQHDADYEPGSPGQLSVYDNGNVRQLVPGVTHNSRGQNLNIDEAGRKVTFHLNVDQGVYSQALGSAQKLKSGNFHFLSGLLPSLVNARAIETTPSGSLTFVLQTQSSIYRSFRMRDLYTIDGSSEEDQTISFGTIPAQNNGGTLALSATTSSGLPVSFRVVSGPAMLSGNTLTFAGAGTVVVQADQEGNIKFNPADSVTQTFVVNKASTTTTVSANNATYDGNPHGGTANVTGPAGLNQSLTVSYSGRNGTTYGPSTTAPTNAGDYTASASYAGDSNYNSSSDSKDYSIAKLSQTINFGALASKTYGDADFSVSATATSGLAVSFNGSGACTVTGSTVHVTGAGTCTVTASQSGDANHSAAPNVPQSFNVAKANQTVTFNPLGDKTYGDADFSVSASASSSLSVSFNASGACTITGSNVHITGAGSCTITASQGGGSNYNAAPNVERSFNIAKASQTITFDPIPDKTYGDADFQVSATASSGLPVSFGIVAGAPCAVMGNAVHISGVGSCVITATQLGNSNYNGAVAVSRDFDIARASTSVALFSSANPSGFEQPVTFTATVASAASTPTGTIRFRVNGASHGNPITLNSDGVASLTIASLTVGSYTVTAEYSGDSNFNASTGTLDEAQVVGTFFGFSQSLYTAAERAGSVTVTVRRTGDTGSEASVDYATDDGSTPSVLVPCSSVTGLSLERCDYTGATATLQFAAGETEKTIVILVSNDSFVEGTETTHLRLSNVSRGAILGSLSSATLEITDDSPESSGNPLDDDESFVRQHYHDFLNREPDAPGIAFWKSQITSCGQDAQCREVKRIHVSAAFFLSIEFQETGYLVYRTYKASYGDATSPGVEGTVPVIRLDEFLTDTQRIGQGLIVGQGDWQTRLEANKVAYFAEFVARPGFVAAAPTTQTPAQFIDALFRNAGVTPTSAQRQAAIDEFGAAANTTDQAARARALHRVAENPTLNQQEFNRAFVLMHYFGYLRRNPNDAPEPTLNYAGWKFWLQKLEDNGGDFVKAEIVRAFITSTEYRQRFGQ